MRMTFSGYFSSIGKRGGKTKSKAKTEAARRNIAKARAARIKNGKARR